jgi:hypothetical protein
MVQTETQSYLMADIIEPIAEFRAMSETEIMAALQDSALANPVAMEVTRLITDFLKTFHCHSERILQTPDLLPLKPRSAIESVALRLTTGLLAATRDARRP